MSIEIKPPIETIDRLVAEYVVNFINLVPPVKFRIWKHQDKLPSMPFYCTQSHYFKGSNRFGSVNKSGCDHAATEEEALRLAIKSVQQPYSEEINAHVMPQRSWLVPNESF